ncbi:MAG: phosphotransferase, partial [Verrucomicrobiota bacterium]
GMEARLNATFSYAECKASLKAIWPIPNLNPLSLVHGDYWPGNVLWKDEQLIAVIDWEETCIDDPLIDLAIARLDVRWVYGKEAMDTFTRLYLRANPIDRTHLHRWDLFAAIRPGDRLAEWAPGYPQLGRDDITAETMTLERRDFAAEALRRLA